MEENKTVAEVTPEVAPAVEETKKSVLNASVAPENFDWDAFENEDVYGASVEEIAEQYNQTLPLHPLWRSMALSMMWRPRSSWTCPVLPAEM